MRVVRDFILIVCAITSTACLIYFAYNIEMLRGHLAAASAAVQTVMKPSVDASENEILKRFRKIDTPVVTDAAPDPSDGYSKPARDSLKKLIDKPATK